MAFSISQRQSVGTQTGLGIKNLEFSFLIDFQFLQENKEKYRRNERNVISIFISILVFIEILSVFLHMPQKKFALFFY